MLNTTSLHSLTLSTFTLKIHSYSHWSLFIYLLFWFNIFLLLFKFMPCAPGLFFYLFIFIYCFEGRILPSSLKSRGVLNFQCCVVLHKASCQASGCPLQLDGALCGDALWHGLELPAALRKLNVCKSAAYTGVSQYTLSNSHWEIQRAQSERRVELRSVSLSMTRLFNKPPV